MGNKMSVGVKSAIVTGILAIVGIIIGVVLPKALGDKSKTELSTAELNRVLADRWEQIDSFLSGVLTSTKVDKEERLRVEALRVTLRSSVELHRAALESGDLVVAHERYLVVMSGLQEMDALLFELKSKHVNIISDKDIPNSDFWNSGISRKMSYEEKKEPDGLLVKIKKWVLNE